MSYSHRAASILVGVALIGAGPAAHAEPVDGPKVSVSVEGADGALLEERRRTKDDWHYVCTIPCKAVVTSGPAFQHRIVDGKKSRYVMIRGQDGDERVVRYERGSESGTPLTVAGVIVSASGMLLAVAGVLKGLSAVDIYGCGGDRLCEEDKSKPGGQGEKDRATRSTAAAMGWAGLGMIVVGVIGVVGGVISSSPSIRVTPRKEQQSPAWARSPSWARPELPRTPSQVTLLDLHF